MKHKKYTVIHQKAYADITYFIFLWTVLLPTSYNLQQLSSNGDIVIHIYILLLISYLYKMFEVHILSKKLQ